MIESFDPNLSMLPPPQADAQPLDPIKPESVKIEKQELQRRKSGDEPPSERKKRKRRKDRGKDSVELSGYADLSEAEPQDTEEPAGEAADDRNETNIDIIV